MTVHQEATLEPPLKYLWGVGIGILIGLAVGHLSFFSSSSEQVSDQPASLTVVDTADQIDPSTDIEFSRKTYGDTLDHSTEVETIPGSKAVPVGQGVTDDLPTPKIVRLFALDDNRQVEALESVGYEANEAYQEDIMAAPGVWGRSGRLELVRTFKFDHLFERKAVLSTAVDDLSQVGQPVAVNGTISVLKGSNTYLLLSLEVTPTENGE